MTNATIGLTLDCNDIVRVAAFWREALGYDEPKPATPDTQFHGLFAPSDQHGLHHMTLQRVPESKTEKCGAHLDLFVDNREVEVARLLSLGASLIAEHAGYFHTSVMGDPEGHEFCVVQRPQS